MKYLAALLLAIGFTTPAFAAWHEAQSDHFVIYADDSEKDVRRFAQMLEQYHASMEYVTGRQVDKPSPSNRVVIFAVGSQRDVRKLAGSKSRSIAGFYIPRAGASRAFVQDIRLKKGYPHFSTTILLHEYAHHFLMSSSRYAMPRWMGEGAAEFFAAASFDGDGGVRIGRPAQHRGNELAYADNVSVPELLDHELYEKNRDGRGDAFYGRSWLLYHYLMFDEDRRGQLSAYARALFSGTPSLEAGEAVFGDLDKLDKELRAYMRQRRMPNIELQPDQLEYGAVTVRRLPEGEAAMMPLRIQSQRGVDRELALELLPEVREVAAKFPADAGVQTALAEAEFDAGNNAEAIAAADAAIALDPRRTNAYVQKGFALFRQAEAAEDADAAYNTAMGAFSALNAIENDHPLPLIYFYRSFTQRSKQPPEQAKHALERASQLAPFDHSLSMNVAVMQANEGSIALARRTLAPLAANPHGGARADAAKTMLDALEGMEEGVPMPSQRAATAVFRED